MKVMALLFGWSPRAMLHLVAASLLSGGLNAAFVAAISQALGAGAAPPLAQLPLFAALALCMAAAMLYAADLALRFGADTLAGLRQGLTAQVLEASPRQVEQTGTARTLAMLTDDLQALGLALRAFPKLAQNAALALGCSAYLLWLSPQAFGLLAGLGLLGGVLFRALLMRAQRHWRRARQALDALFARYRDVTDAHAELALHVERRRAFLDREVVPATRRLRALEVAAMRRAVVAQASTHLTFIAVIALLLFALPRWQTLPAGSLTGFVVVVLYAMARMRAVTTSVGVFARAAAALEHVEGLGFQLTPRPAPGPTPRSRAPLREPRPIRLRGVRYRYDGREGFALGPLDLCLEPGQLVFVTGGNGSGKSTLARLVTGLYRPDAGQVRFGDEPVHASNLAWYRQHFSFVSAAAPLLPALPDLADGSRDGEARRLLERFGLADRIRFERGAWSTTALSQGQRKRLALVVALLDDRPVQVFDEWAAEQDPTFRHRFYTELLPELRARGRTVLAISHDERYFDLADRVLRLDLGRLEAPVAPAVGSAVGYLRIPSRQPSPR